MFIILVLDKPDGLDDALVWNSLGQQMGVTGFNGVYGYLLVIVSSIPFYFFSMKVFLGSSYGDILGLVYSPYWLG